MASARRRPGILGDGLFAPTLAVVGLLILAPLAYSLVLSLYQWKITDINGPKPFVGLANYTHLFHDSTLLVALRNTVLYVVGSVGVELVLGFIVTAALFEMTKGRRLANSLILLPMIVAP